MGFSVLDSATKDSSSFWSHKGLRGQRQALREAGSGGLRFAFGFAAWAGIVGYPGGFIRRRRLYVVRVERVLSALNVRRQGVIFCCRAGEGKRAAEGFGTGSGLAGMFHAKAAVGELAKATQSPNRIGSCRGLRRRAY
jgi:hypothetical protein